MSRRRRCVIARRTERKRALRRMLGDAVNVRAVEAFFGKLERETRTRARAMYTEAFLYGRVTLGGRTADASREWGP